MKSAGEFLKLKICKNYHLKNPPFLPRVWRFKNEQVFFSIAFRNQSITRWGGCGDCANYSNKIWQKARGLAPRVLAFWLVTKSPRDLVTGAPLSHLFTKVWGQRRNLLYLKLFPKHLIWSHPSGLILIIRSISSMLF